MNVGKQLVEDGVSGGAVQLDIRRDQKGHFVGAVGLKKVLVVLPRAKDESRVGGELLKRIVHGLQCGGENREWTQECQRHNGDAPWVLRNRTANPFPESGVTWRCDVEHSRGQ